MILEHTICSKSLQGTHAGQGNWTIVASERPVSLFEQGTNVCLKTILWGFQPSLLTVEKDVQQQDLAQMPIPLGLWDEAHQGLKLSTGSNGSGSTRPDTNSARESTRPRVNSAGSTRPVIFFLIEVYFIST